MKGVDECPACARVILRKSDHGRACMMRLWLPFPSAPHPSEHDKLMKVKDKSQACGEFLEWLIGERGYTLAISHEHDDGCWTRLNGERRCELRDGALVPAGTSVRRLLAEFFEIDEKKLEAEKVEMLAQLRESP